MVFRKTFYVPSSGDEVAWPKPHSSVELVELSCTVNENKTGRTAKCVPGSAIEPKFAPLLRDDAPPLGKEMKERLAECYAVRARAPSALAIASYEAALRASASATPPPIDDAWIIAYVAHDQAPFVGKCKPEPDGSCLYSATEQPTEGSVEERVALRGKAMKAVPFTPSPREITLSFFDGHQPVAIERVPLVKEADTNAGPGKTIFDPAKVDWDPVIAWYRANEPSSENLAAALVLAGRLTEARGLRLREALDRDDFLPNDPCRQPR